MLYCFTNLNTNKAEINYAKRHNSFVFFDINSKKFYKDENKTEETIDISGKEVLPRTTSEEETKEVIDRLLDLGASPLYWNLVKYKNIIRWSSLRITNREILVLRGNNFIEQNSQLERMLKKLSDEENTVFIETSGGSFARRVLRVDLLNPESPIRKTIAKYPDEEIRISKPCKILEDELGERQYNCVVKDGKIQSISRGVDNVYHSIEEKIVQFCKQKVSDLNKIGELPEAYVLNVAEYEYSDDETPRIDVLEIKPVYTAEMGLYNSILDLTENNDKEVPNNNIYDIDPVKKEEFLETGMSPRSFATEADKRQERVKESKFEKTFEEYKRQQAEKEKRQEEKRQSLRKSWILSNWLKEKE